MFDIKSDLHFINLTKTTGIIICNGPEASKLLGWWYSLKPFRCSKKKKEKNTTIFSSNDLIMFTWTLQGMLILICFPKYWFTCVKRVKREKQHQSILWFFPRYISLTITLQGLWFDLTFYITYIYGLVFGWCWNDACTNDSQFIFLSWNEICILLFRYFDKIWI